MNVEKSRPTTSREGVPKSLRGVVFPYHRHQHLEIFFLGSEFSAYLPSNTPTISVCYGHRDGHDNDLFSRAQVKEKVHAPGRF